MSLEDLLRAANIATPVIVAIIGFAVRQMMARMLDRIARLEADRRDDVERLMTAEMQMQTLGETFVRREDWIREQARTRQTLERLVEGQARLEGKLDASALSAAARLIAARNENGERHE